jgi:hypothetical protein
MRITFSFLSLLNALKMLEVTVTASGLFVGEKIVERYEIYRNATLRSWDRSQTA